MPKTVLLKAVLAIALSSMIGYGCAGNTEQMREESTQAVQESKKQQLVYKGKVVGFSNKAKSISLAVGKGKTAKTVILKFDKQTQGVTKAVKGKKVIISYEKRDNVLYALQIKLKLAKLPTGVTEIKTEELHDILASNKDLFLVDSRPIRRYDQSHLPDAVSIPVPLLKDKKASLFPKDKDTLLVFYCGGPT